MSKVRIKESDLKELIKRQVSSVLNEGIEVVSRGSSSSKPNVGDGREPIAEGDVKFLGTLAKEAAEYLGLSKNLRISSRAVGRKSWDQIEFEESFEGQLSYHTFLTLDKIDDTRYKLSADAATQSSDGVEAFQTEYIIFEAPAGLSEQDVDSRLVSRFAEMIEDAEMQAHKSPEYFDPAGRNPPGI